MTDDRLEFDGTTPDRRPLGGAEAAFLSLAEAFAARGHAVRVRNNCSAALTRNGVQWTPIVEGVPDTCDLYIHRAAVSRQKGLSWSEMAARFEALIP